MWYTHYFSDLKDHECLDIIYQDFLKSIIEPITKMNLYDLFVSYNNKEWNELWNLTFEQCFHEVCWDKDNKPIFSLQEWWFSFCKTNRKLYDIAIVLTQVLAYKKWFLEELSSDWDLTIFEKDWNIKDQIFSYVNKQLDYCYNYDIDKLTEVYNYWLNKK